MSVEERFHASISRSIRRTQTGLLRSTGVLKRPKIRRSLRSEHVRQSEAFLRFEAEVERDLEHGVSGVGESEWGTDAFDGGAVEQAAEDVSPLEPESEEEEATLSGRIAGGRALLLRSLLNLDAEEERDDEQDAPSARIADGRALLLRSLDLATGADAGAGDSTAAFGVSEARSSAVGGLLSAATSEGGDDTSRAMRRAKSKLMGRRVFCGLLAVERLEGHEAPPVVSTTTSTAAGESKMSSAAAAESSPAVEEKAAVVKSKKGPSAAAAQESPSSPAVPGDAGAATTEAQDKGGETKSTAAAQESPSSPAVPGDAGAATTEVQDKGGETKSTAAAQESPSSPAVPGDAGAATTEAQDKGGETKSTASDAAPSPSPAPTASEHPVAAALAAAASTTSTVDAAPAAAPPAMVMVKEITALGPKQHEAHVAQRWLGIFPTAAAAESAASEAVAALMRGDDPRSFVSHDPRFDKWSATVDGKWVGYFDTKDKAIAGFRLFGGTSTTWAKTTKGDDSGALSKSSRVARSRSTLSSTKRKGSARGGKKSRMGKSVEEFEKSLVDFFKEHNPEKIPSAGKLARKFAKKQEGLMKLLRKKYIENASPKAGGNKGLPELREQRTQRRLVRKGQGQPSQSPGFRTRAASRASLSAGGGDSSKSRLTASHRTASTSQLIDRRARAERMRAREADRRRPGRHRSASVRTGLSGGGSAAGRRGKRAPRRRRHSMMAAIPDAPGANALDAMNRSLMSGMDPFASVMDPFASVTMPPPPPKSDVRRQRLAKSRRASASASVSSSRRRGPRRSVPTLPAITSTSPAGRGNNKSDAAKRVGSKSSAAAGRPTSTLRPRSDGARK